MAQFDLAAEMLRLGLSVMALAKLTGRSRITVWRWKKSGLCPDYVRTILSVRAEPDRTQHQGSVAPAPHGTTAPEN